MSMHISVINGPNLNLLGQRQPEVYGDTTLERLQRLLTAWGRSVGAQISHFQSNHEGAIIDHLHSLRGETDGLLINPGAFTHYSRALADALASVEIPTVEVHISNIMEREPWRRRSVVSEACVRTIYGRGVEGYLWGVRHLHYRRLGNPQEVMGEDGAVGDLRLPEGRGPHPVLVLLHGGGWMGQWRRDQLDGMAVDLAARGYATYNFEYLPPHRGGRFPVTLETTRQAHRLIASREDLDTDRLALVGHSAGGNLALMASLWWRRWGHSPRLAVSMAGVTTLRSDSDLDRAYLRGQDPAAGSPRFLLPLGVDTLMIHATDDDIVPAEHSTGYAEEASAAGDPVQTLILPRGGHLGFLDMNNQAWRHAREGIISAFPP
ncbi:MAG: type II 3-dehydroquinate dehydratase [Actinomycetia bacterium]|nr:type II 3-dehydroquinate dehydratase [Actinomycetes bacterium]